MNKTLRRFTDKLRSFANKSLPVAIAAGLIASVLIAAVPTAHAAPVQNLTPAARISFTFDDGLLSALNKAAPALNGLPATAYVISHCVGMTTTPNQCLADGTKPYMTWDQIKQLKNMGWEIASHTVNHPYLASNGGGDQDHIPDATEVHNELKGSQDAFATQNISATNIAFPYGDYDSNVLAEAAKWYESARGFADTDALNNWPYNNSLLLNQQVQSGAPAPDWSVCTDMSVAGVKTCVDHAITAGQWLVLTFHDVSDTPGTSEESYDYKTSDLAEVAAYVKSKQTASQIKAVTISDGLVHGTNMLKNGDLAAGLGTDPVTQWTTDDATNITANNGTNGRYPEPVNSISLKSAANATDTTEKHLFSPQVAVTFGQTYLISNYLNILSGGSIHFAVDEYANGSWVSWVDAKAGRTYNAEKTAFNVADVGFTYTPSSAAVTSARLQVIVRGANVNAYFDGVKWLWTGESVTQPVVDPYLGDANGDKSVGLVDLQAVSVHWGMTGMTRTNGDLEGNDGDVDLYDLQVLSTNWGKQYE